MTVKAGIEALEGRSHSALVLYNKALRVWRDLGLAWDEALCGLDMAILLDPADVDAQAAAQSSRETFLRLGAKPFLTRLDAAVETHATAKVREPRRSPKPATV